ALDKISLKEDKPIESTVLKLSREEEIGFHKGALNTLLSERNELVKMIGNVEAIMQAHLKILQEFGINIETKK
ncbi:MAG: hypothetical protein AABW67_05430, partial [Nanoarchaeota archaeon]